MNCAKGGIGELVFVYRGADNIEPESCVLIKEVAMDCLRITTCTGDSATT